MHSMKQEKSSKFAAWVNAARLRTLPLALSSVIMGSFLAVFSGIYSWSVIGLALLTTLILQILSNFANDYGDALKGTDNEHRLGPTRMVQSGNISPGEMRKGILISIILSLISGVLLIYISLGDQWKTGLLFFILGLASIGAAIKYVVGTNAYGYRGWGDLFVFLFFGLTGVVGTYFLNTLTIPLSIWLPAASLGFFSTGVLNLNNMRDTENDRNSGKKTIPVRLGFKLAKWYHFGLLSLGWIFSIVFTLIWYHSSWQWIYLIVLPFFIVDFLKITKIAHLQELDPFLKKLALSTFFYTLLFGLGLALSM